jgi:hypothetical protein
MIAGIEFSIPTGTTNPCGENTADLPTFEDQRFWSLIECGFQIVSRPIIVVDDRPIRHNILGAALWAHATTDVRASRCWSGTSDISSRRWFWARLEGLGWACHCTAVTLLSFPATIFIRPLLPHQRHYAIDQRSAPA